ncbi:MAG: hypothetical protein OJF62_001431 [Pseudolabrys sp.]|jgi:CheY-like chemotaxis protein|nr:hypothetical protein [Pseudolabrys sp.]
MFSFVQVRADRMSNKAVRDLIQGLGILIVDNNAYMRRLTRMMLVGLGAKSVYEAGDGLAALEIVRASDPDVMMLERDIPVLSGPELLRIIRSPEIFPRPNLPIIMLTSRANRSDVIEALRLGVHELLIKPTSPKALQDRLISVVSRPRPMVWIGQHYVPEPRRVITPAAVH